MFANIGPHLGLSGSLFGNSFTSFTGLRSLGTLTTAQAFPIAFAAVN